MFRLILKRLLLLIPVLIGVTFLVFSILSFAPGDPVLVVLGDNATEEAAEAMRSELGLDKPFLERYVNYIWDLLHGDFGKSYKTKLSVSDQILSRFPNTILLALSSMLSRCFSAYHWVYCQQKSNIPCWITSRQSAD